MRKTDSRVSRTKLLLHRSLATLIHEKSYDAIVVKEILARANVARSTFYAHFDGKEELLLSSIRHVLAVARDRLSELSDPVDRLLYFSLPVLQHIETHLQQAPVDAPRLGLRQVHRRLEKVLIEQVEADIRRTPLMRAMPAVPPELLAKHLVTTFLVVVDWWLHRRPVPSAREADDSYRALVAPILRANRRA
ncbi:TetR/AcrR family transcriptional regulator [Rhodanobacter umsongensis]|uniref:TetR/AcrR family transcriptional regulator n=1 Tax=Rhodanobacter umsongensis TaxID=633153 RepID=A0ABW0JJB1_9GAMM